MDGNLHCGRVFTQHKKIRPQWIYSIGRTDFFKSAVFAACAVMAVKAYLNSVLPTKISFQLEVFQW